MIPGDPGDVWAWTSAEAAVPDPAYRFRSNDFNRRRYGGLWGYMAMVLALMGVLHG